MIPLQTVLLCVLNMCVSVNCC